MTVDIIVNPSSPKGNKQKTTPPRVKNTTGNSKNNSPISNKDSQNITTVDDHCSNHSDSEEGFKKPTDDVLTEDDTDVEEEDNKIFLGLAHESNDVSNSLNNGVDNKSNANLEKYEYNAYTTAHLDKIYHPTSSIFEENTKKDDNHNQPGFFNGSETTTTSFLAPHFSTAEDTFLQDNSTIYERAAFHRRPSQLQHEMTSLNALGPPSHVLKARRLSKTVIATSSSTPIAPVKSLSTNSISLKDKRKPSLVSNYSKEFSDSNNSAVSPRFMAMRKLSEVTTLPSHSISYSAVPPVPQIPATYHNAADDHTNPSISSDAVKKTINNSTENENRILARIDDIIETQLQFHLGQVIWRASESHLEARKFWEEQKKEMFGFAATLVDRMETQEDMTRRMTLGSLVPEKKDEEVTIDSLKQEIAIYKTRTQKQLFEIESLRTRNYELEKQHEIDVISMSKQWENKDATLKRLKELEHAYNNNSKRQKNPQVTSLETEANKQLKTQLKQMEAINKQLLEEITNLKLELKSRNKDIKILNCQLLETKSSGKRKVSTSTAGASDSNENLLDKSSVKNGKSENWADIMESEDEAKKSAEEWANKYRELQSSYFEVCLQVDKSKKNGISPEDEKKIFELSQSIIAKDEEIRHLKQAENVNRIQMDYMQLELNKYQKRSISPMSEADENIKQKPYKSAKRKSQHRKSTPPIMHTKKEPSLQQQAPIQSSPKVRKEIIDSRPATPQKKLIEPAQLEQQVASPPTKTETRPSTPPVAETSSSSEYVTENGFLTFTTEINGVLSNYSIKLPTAYQQQSAKNNKPQNNPVQEPKVKKNRLNPNAVTWKAK